MIDIVDELRKNGMKFVPLRPRKLSPKEMKRHKQIQKAVRAFLKSMDEISRATGKSSACFRGRAVSQYSQQYDSFSRDFQKTRV